MLICTPTPSLPGSQNGYDNSGQRTSNPTWASNATNVAVTLDVLKFVVRHVGGMIDVIELLNEPAGFMGDDFVRVLREFWQDGYDEVRAIADPALRVMIGDGFIGVDVRRDLHYIHPSVLFSDMATSRRIGETF